MRAIACSIVLALVVAAPARADEELVRAVRELEREVAKLRAEQPANRPFSVGAFNVKLSGFVQADAVAYHSASVDELNPATTEPLNETRFALRRARLRLAVDYRYVAGVLELDGNTVRGPTVRALDAEVSVQWPGIGTGALPYVMASLGLMRIPFGFEVQERDYLRLFLERSNVIRALFPGEFDLGVRVQGAWRFLRYQVALMNGNPAGDRQFTLRDPNRNKDLVGRLGIDVTLAERVRLETGLSGVYGQGFHAGTPATKSTLVWRDTNLDGQVDPTELSGVSGSPATPSLGYRRYAFGGDVRLTAKLPRLGTLAVYGEGVWAQSLDRGLAIADPVARQRALREVGWYVAFSLELTRWAMVGIRYDYYDPDADFSERSGARIVPRDQSFSTVAVAVAGVWAPYARVVFEYDHNRNALGRDASGAPTTLGAHVATFRAQVAY